MCSSNLQLAPNTGSVQISIANPNLNGQGTIVPLITGNGSGTMINSITITSLVPNTQGMVRLFLNDGVRYYLIREVMIPANVPTNVVPAFSATITTPINLKAGYSLGVATQNGETFSITAYGANYTNCPC